MTPPIVKGMHPLATIVRDALHGQFPAGDGLVERLPAWRPGLEAVVAFTGHGYLCLQDDRPVPAAAKSLSHDAFGGLTDPRLITALAGPDAGRHDIDSLDVLLAAGASDEPLPHLVLRTDLAHPRITFARRWRDDVRALTTTTGPDDSVVVLATGLAGLTEVSIEIAPRSRGRGNGTAMLRAVRASLAPEEIVVAMVAPGNAASLRTFLAAGFTPVGGAQVWFAP